MNNVTLHHGDCLPYLRTLPDNSVDAVVTDPPYGLGVPPDPAEVLRSWLDDGTHTVKGGGFMGKEWDAFVPQPALWKEVLRVLKPGGHCAAFFGTRTFDWGVMAMRLAGFDVRTSLVWVFGSGFPKGCAIDRAIDKELGLEREVVGTYDTRGLYDESKRGGPTVSTGEWRESSFTTGCHAVPITAPASPEAAAWAGWNTQLKPAHEPIVLAMKPLSEKTYAANVRRWGTGALNIGGCRIDHVGDKPIFEKLGGDGNGIYGKGLCNSRLLGTTTEGRYPATVLHDGSDAVMGMFPHSTSNDNDGPIFCRNVSPALHAGGGKNVPGNFNGFRKGFVDAGSNARYFASCSFSPDDVPVGLYCAKASPAERNLGVTSEAVVSPHISNSGDGRLNRNGKLAFVRNIHPTCKPITLMRWLVRLVTPPGGTVLDPFTGSGTTGMAAVWEGMDFIGCEMGADYHAIADQRIRHAQTTPPPPAKWGLPERTQKTATTKKQTKQIEPASQPLFAQP